MTKAQTESQRWGLPTPKDMKLLQAETDPLRLIVIGWQWIEGLLAMAIGDHLPAGADVVAFERIPASMRIDICAGLGIIPLQTHPSFVRMNTIRNQFVHKRKSALTRKDGYDLFNTWDAGMRDIARKINVTGRSSPFAIVRATLIIQYVLVEKRIEQHRDGRISQELLYEGLIALADRKPAVDRDAEFERRKRQRKAAGQL